MKKLLLSCDEYAFFLEGHYYLSEFGFILIQRYLRVFDKLRLAVRIKNISTKELLIKNAVLCDNENVEFLPIPFFQGPVEYSKQYLKVNKVLHNAADDCDAAVLRLPSTVAFACLSTLFKNKIPFGVEVIANPNELKKSSKNIIYITLMYLWHHQLKKACRCANAVSYVTKNNLQELYPTSKQNYKTYYSSIEMDNSFFYRPRVLNNTKEIRIAHISSQIKTFTKGHMTVLYTVKILKDKGFDIVARFAGDGEYINIFINKAKELGILEQIAFVGPLNRKELNEFLRYSNIMIFPSISEGLPRVLIEAMASGLPCLSTPVGGIPELLDNNLLFNPSDSASFAEKTIEIFSNGKLYNQLSEQNYNRSLEFKKNILDKKRNDLYKYLYNLT